ncbi:MAG TPA: hypothetical protein VKF80_09930 [Candidatus Eisenbacteria bacterium]|nr:hypothetical protein [Candidatus Eisenbacteria bacterium]
MKTRKTKRVAAIAMIAMVTLMAAQQAGASLMPPPPRGVPEDPGSSAGLGWIHIERAILWETVIRLMI